MSYQVLITGGAGFIGSHTLTLLLGSGFDCIVLDSFCSSSPEAIKRVQQISGRQVKVIKGDVRDRFLLREVFKTYSIKSVFHFAGLKSVAESVANPLVYYDVNFCGTQVLLEIMNDAKVFDLVFSSSATIYGQQSQSPIPENSDFIQPVNPYGKSKLFVEEMLQDLASTDSRWRIAIFRYFNPVGAHESGLIGEDSMGIPNNLLPYISRVALGKLPELSVFGSDYPTPDGTGVRDYIHIMDLAEGHLKALEALETGSGVRIWNLGTGRGYSVLEVMCAFETATGKPVPYRIAPRRLGDVAICYADPSKAERELGWKAKRGLGQMMLDAWRWQSMNPNGYR